MGNIQDFAGKKYLAADGSAIDFKEDGSFVWYQSDENHEDNFLMEFIRYPLIRKL